MNKLDCIDKIIAQHNDHAEYVDQNPDYSLPNGLPCINLEIRTNKTVELYVLVDFRTSEDLIKDIGEAYDALRYAAVKVQDKGERNIQQWIQLFNTDREKLKAYEARIAKLLMKKMSESPPPQLLADTPRDSTAKQLYRQMAKPVLN